MCSRRQRADLQCCATVRTIISGTSSSSKRKARPAAHALRTCPPPAARAHAAPLSPGLWLFSVAPASGVIWYRSLRDWLLLLSMMPSGLTQAVAATGLTGLAFDRWLGVCQAGRGRVGGGGVTAGAGPGCADGDGLPGPLHARSCPPCAQVTPLGVLLPSSFSPALRPPASPADFGLQPDPGSDGSCCLPCAHFVPAAASLSWVLGVDPNSLCLCPRPHSWHVRSKVRQRRHRNADPPRRTLPFEQVPRGAVLSAV